MVLVAPFVALGMYDTSTRAAPFDPRVTALGFTEHPPAANDPQSGVSAAEARAFADRAVAALAGAVRAGSPEAAELKGPDFDAVRHHDDFRKLAAALAKGAAGGAEAVVAVLALTRGVIPPTINYATPDPDCDLDYVPNQPREVRVDAVMSNSFGFGGTNAVLLFKRYSK